MDDSIWANVASFLGETPPAAAETIAPVPEDPRSQSELDQPQAAPTKPSLFILCFSKDRPFQLNEFLRSCLLANLEACRGGLVRIYVLWKAEDEVFKEKYVTLSERYSFVHFVAEQKGGFSRHVGDVLQECSSQANNGLVLFAVDDAVFYRPVRLTQILRFMRQRKDLLCLQLKLSSHIRRCQPRAFAEMEQPHFVREGDPPEFLTFETGSGSLDWNYPWDLTCSIYPLRVASRVVEQLNILGMQYDSPNTLEAQGGLCIKLLLKDKAFPCRCAILAGMQCMSVVTVNRVQNVYRTPVYDTAQTFDIYSLNDIFDEKEANLPLYAQQEAYDTVHIGHMFLVPKCTLSVLIPVRNAESFLPTALRSLFAQDCQDVFEIIIIDDGSEDDTLRVAQEFMAEQQVLIRLVSNKGVGVGAALNTGLSNCRGDFIGRMDADDICSPTRFRKQLDYMRQSSQVFALGGNAYVFSKGEASYSVDAWASATKGLKRIDTVAEPWKVEWESYYCCAMIHPTVVMDRAKLLSLGGYSETSKAEDYDLWLRALCNGYKLENLSGEPLLMLRKHCDNASTKVDPRRVSVETALRAWGSLVEVNERRIVNTLSVRLLQFNEMKAEKAKERISMAEIVNLVVCLESLVLQKYGKEDNVVEWLRQAANSRIASLVAAGYIHTGSSKRLVQALGKRGMSLSDILSSVLDTGTPLRNTNDSKDAALDLDELD